MQVGTRRIRRGARRRIFKPLDASGVVDGQHALAALRPEEAGTGFVADHDQLAPASAGAGEIRGVDPAPDGEPGERFLSGCVRLSSYSDAGD
jgi:hypothetical protein